MEAADSTPSRRRGRLLWTLLGIAVAAPLGLWALNYCLVGQPVMQAHEADPRNTTFTMDAHYGRYMDPTTLVLDLTGELGQASPADLMRGTFQAAEVMHEMQRSFGSVVLAREGEPVFLLSGTDFSQIGQGFDEGQNPVYLSRTFPEKLRKPDGSPAFETWTGGLLGVVGKQMQDVNTMAVQWATGGTGEQVNL